MKALIFVLGPLGVAAAGFSLAGPELRANANHGRGQKAAVVLRGDVSDRRIGPLSLSGPFRAVESARNVRVRNLLIERLVATDVQREGIRLRGDVDGVIIRDFRLEMRREPQTPPNLPEGIAIQSGSRIAISDGSLRGFRMTKTIGRYTNGDGLAAERPVRGLSIQRVVATDNSDAGFDIKSREVKLDQLRAERNHRNYRFWGEIDAGALTSIDPTGAHVWVGGNAIVRIRRLIARSDTRAPLLHVERAREIVIESCDLRLPRGTVLVKGGAPAARISLGPGCRRT